MLKSMEKMNMGDQMRLRDTSTFETVELRPIGKIMSMLA